MSKDINMVLENRAQMINGILEGMDAEFSVCYQQVPKNNCDRDAYILRPRQDGIMSPTVYLNGELLEQTDGQLALTLMDLYKHHSMAAPDVSALTSRDRLLETVLPRLASVDNEARLKGADRVCERVSDLNLVVSYYVSIDEYGSDDSIATMAITNGMLRNAGILIEELKAAAIRNMRDQVDITSMSDVLASIGMPMPDSEGCPILVVSNRSRNLGAAAILVPEVIENLQSRLGACFYILPSSIHEVLAVPADLSMDAMGLVEMVQEINSSTVALEERLADNAYLCQDGALSMVG